MSSSWKPPGSSSGRNGDEHTNSVAAISTALVESQQQKSRRRLWGLVTTTTCTWCPLTDSGWTCLRTSIYHAGRLRRVRRRQAALRRRASRSCASRDIDLPAGLARTTAGTETHRRPGQPQERPRAEAHPRRGRQGLPGLGHATSTRCATPACAPPVVSSSANCRRGARGRRHRATCSRRASTGTWSTTSSLQGQAGARHVPARGAEQLGVERERGGGVRGRAGRRRGRPRRQLRLRRRRRPRRPGRRAASSTAPTSSSRTSASCCAVISHDAYPAEPWAVRETALDLDFLAQSESLFALSNGHLGPARQPRRGRAARPQRHLPQRLLRVVPARATASAATATPRTARRGQRHRRQAHPAAGRGRAAGRPPRAPAPATSACSTCAPAC